MNHTLRKIQPAALIAAFILSAGGLALAAGLPATLVNPTVFTIVSNGKTVGTTTLPKGAPVDILKEDSATGKLYVNSTVGAQWVEKGAVSPAPTPVQTPKPAAAPAPSPVSQPVTVLAATPKQTPAAKRIGNPGKPAEPSPGTQKDAVDWTTINPQRIVHNTNTGKREIQVLRDHNLGKLPIISNGSEIRDAKLKVPVTFQVDRKGDGSRILNLSVRIGSYVSIVGEPNAEGKVPVTTSILNLDTGTSFRANTVYLDPSEIEILPKSGKKPTVFVEANALQLVDLVKILGSGIKTDIHSPLRIVEGSPEDPKNQTPGTIIVEPGSPEIQFIKAEKNEYSAMGLTQKVASNATVTIMLGSITSWGDPISVDWSISSTDLSVGQSVGAGFTGVLLEKLESGGTEQSLSSLTLSAPTKGTLGATSAVFESAPNPAGRGNLLTYTATNTTRAKGPIALRLKFNNCTGTVILGKIRVYSNEQDGTTAMNPRGDY
jgi:hypothetical protein